MTEQSDDKKRIAAEKANPEKYMVPMLRAPFNLPSQQALAEHLRLKPNHLAKIKGDPKSAFPRNTQDYIIELGTKENPPVNLTRDSFRLDKKAFLGCIQTDHPRYLAVLIASGLFDAMSPPAPVPVPATNPTSDDPVPDGRLPRLFGT
jgi:hypothetical protein